MQSQYQTLCCPICMIQYDKEVRIPRIIPPCGHTICMACLDLILQGSNNSTCPLDNTTFTVEKRSIESFPVNFGLLNIVLEMLAEELCHEHLEKKILVCFTDKTKICHDCALFGNHKGHDIKPLKKIKLNCKHNEQQLQKALDTLDAHHEEMNNRVQDMKISMEKTIKFRFKELQQLLKSKELELLQETKYFFDYQKQQIYTTFGAHSTLRRDLAEKISEYKQPQDDQFFKLLDEDLELLTSKIDHETFTVDAEQFEKELSMSISNLDDQLSGLARIIHKSVLQYETMAQVCSEYFAKYLWPPLDTGFEPHHLLRLHTNLQIKTKADILEISLRRNNNKETAIKMSNLKNIKKVTFYMDQYALTNEDNAVFQYICKHVDEKIELEIHCYSKEATNSVISQILYTISPIVHRFQSFAFKLGNCKLVNDESIFYLMEKVLPNMKNTKSLTIWLFGTSISDQSVLDLMKYNTGTIKSLSRFEINLADTMITDAAIVKLFIPMTCIVNYYLNLALTKITDVSVEAFVKNSLLSMKNLQSFEFYLSRTQVTDRFISFPENVSGIKKFGLGLGGINISEELLVKLNSGCLEKMTSLEDLDLRIYESKIGDKEAEGVCVPMQTVKKLCLAMYKTDITDEAISKFAESTLSSIQDLKEIQVYLGDTNITDKGALTLFANVINLNKLTLSLPGTKITDEFGEEFLRLLPKMEALDNFLLDLKNTNITEEVLKKIELARTELLKAKKG